MNEPGIPRRKSHRLESDLYNLPGAYFIPICTHLRRSTFARFHALKLVLTPLGRLADDRWQAIPGHHQAVKLDWYVVMPNHIHGILILLPSDLDRPESVSNVINQYKSSVTRSARRPGIADHNPIWQTRFWDHIVRDEEDLNRIREYIRDNPVKWHLDRENKDRVGLHTFYLSLVENSVSPAADRYVPDV